MKKKFIIYNYTQSCYLSGYEIRFPFDVVTYYREEEKEAIIFPTRYAAKYTAKKLFKNKLLENNEKYYIFKLH